MANDGSVTYEFQSTLPVRGGTLSLKIILSEDLHISIHPPRAGRDSIYTCAAACGTISIHPPRAGRDSPSTVTGYRSYLFQSTLPVRGGT